MNVRRWHKVLFFAVALLVARSFPLHAEPSGAQGANTGDGSTPFTGLARAPEANLFIGSATTEIPIQVPPGRAGIAPKLSLKYSSQGGPSPYGYGWDLPLGHVQRSTKEGAILCGREPANFLIVLPEGQVECVLEGSRCWPTVEDSFLRIEYQAADDTWTIFDRSGRRYTFGSAFAAREPAMPLAGCSTFRWYLTRVEDANGNYLIVLYDTNARRDTSYPLAIQYTGNPNQESPIPFEVRFVWSTSRFSCPDGKRSGRPCEDRIIEATGGYPRELERLLDRIEIFHFGYRVRQYGFEYEFDLGGGERLGRVSFLSAVTLYDGNGRALSRLDRQPASTTFLYRDLQGHLGFAGTQLAQRPTFANPLGIEPYQDALRLELRVQADRATYREVTDVNGDGFPDLVDINESCMTWAIDGTLLAARWDVHTGSLRGFDPVPTAWDLFEVASVLGRSGNCPAFRLSRTHEEVTWSESETVDLTGDGVPDYVSNQPWTQSNPYWLVFPGIRPSTAQEPWRFGTPQLWWAPRRELRRSEGDVHFLGHDGSADVADLIDMSGDGRPDYVLAPVGGDQIQIWFNTGSGFSPNPSPFRTPWRVLRFTNTRGLLVATMADMNGDGLADQVITWDRSGGKPYAGVWRVMINTGNQAVGPLDWYLPPSSCGWNGVRQALNDGRGDVVRDLFDINGDGLADLVEACQNGQRSQFWQVWLNRGAGFATQPVAWPAPRDAIRKVTDQDFGTAGVTRYHGDVFDLDADGTVDSVQFFAERAEFTRSAAGAWCASTDGVTCADQGPLAARTDMVRTDLMVQMENGIGGTIYLDYEPASVWDNTDAAGVWRLPWSHWTLSAITTTDGWCTGEASQACSAPYGDHESTLSFAYAYGLYEPSAREFRGFRTVARIEPGGVRQLLFFHQDAIRIGRKQAVSLVDNQERLLRFETETWECVPVSAEPCRSDPSTCAPTACPHLRAPGERFWTRRSEALRYDTENFMIRKVVGTRNLGWDAYGNVTRTLRFATGTPSVETFTLYASWNEPDRYLVDRAVENWTFDHGTNRIVERVWHDYDQRGNPVTTYRWVDQVLPALAARFVPCPGGGNCTRTRMEYDALGNLTSSEDTEGRRTEYRYDTRLQTYVVRAINPLGQQTDQHFHPVCGTKIEESIPYLSADWFQQSVPSTRWQYDEFCRLRAQFRTMDPPERPYLRIRHAIGGSGQPSVIAIEQLVSGSRRATRYQLFDALGRLIQTQRDSYVDRRRATIIEATRFYDARGRLAVEFAPFTVRWTRGRYVTPPLAYGATLVSYDLLDRPTERIAPDGAVTRFEYPAAWSVETIDPCANAGTCEGARTLEKRDGFGRVVKKTTRSGDRFLQGTASRFDAFGRVVETLQGTAPGVWDAATASRFTYDSRGLLIQREDPNSGVWQYGYDANGNLVYVNDPASGRHISLCYDALGRLIAKYYSSGDSYVHRCDDPRPDVRYQYDRHVWASSDFPNLDPRGAVSRLTAVYEATGTNFTFYDVHGRPVANQLTLSLPGEPDTRGTLLWEYDAAGNIASVTYPDGERVRYRYDPAGQVYAVIGQRVYARRIGYDMFARPRELLLGNGVRDVREYADVSNNFRLSSSRSERAGQILQQLNYSSYNANGFLATLSEPNAPAVPDLDRSAAFTYDGLGRLRAVHLPGANADLEYAYDALGNLVQKEGSTLFYTRQRPHQVVAVDGLEHPVQYDANGNRIRNANRTYEYDAENRLVRVDGGAVEFAYDQAGNRIGMRNGGGPWTRNYFGLAEAENGYLTKYYFAGKILLASQKTANPAFASAPGRAAIRLVASHTAAGTPFLQIVVGPDAAPVFALLGLALIACLWIAPSRTRLSFLGKVGRGRIALVAMVFFFATFPWPLVVRPTAAQGLPSEFAYYHLNHVGSTEMITSDSGAVMAHIRFAPFGGLIGYFGADGRRLSGLACGDVRACRDFTGYQREPLSGLLYAGARFYDSDIAMFQSHDPARQFFNPYSYAAWNPTNLTDANGEFIEILIAVLVAAVLSAAISAMAAAAQGLPLSQIGKAAISGAIAGAVGVGLGVVAATANMVISSLAGSAAQGISVAQAVNTLRVVAVRSAFSTVASHATQEIGNGAGLPGDLVKLGAAAAGIFTSAYFDQKILNPGGFEPARQGIIPASDTATHADITREAALDAGYSGFEAEILVRNNLAQDAFGEPWYRQWWAALNNQGHFSGAAAENYRAALDRIVTGDNKLQALGAASHFLQDQHALGHMFPGTHLFRGPLGAPFRFVIHQAVGGEVTFVGASRQATTQLFRTYRNLHFT